MPRTVDGYKNKKRAFALAGQGLNQTEIAARIGVRRETVNRWFNGGESHPQEVRPEPKPLDKLPEDVRAMLEDTPEAFEAFFNRYSGLRLKPHSKSFIQAAWGKKRVVVNVPPGHAKSTIFSVWLPIWLVCRNRDLRIIVLSQTDTLALDFTSEIAQIMEENDDLIRDFGRFKPEKPDTRTWMPGKGMIRVEGSKLTRGHNILARGSGQQVQGKRADLVIADDVVDPKVNTKTELVREELVRWYRGILTTRLSPTGMAWVIGTRWHPEDLYGSLAEVVMPDGENLYTHVNFPALSLDGEPSLEVEALELWPHDPADGECTGDDCRNRAYLDRQIAEMGTPEFMQTYQQIPLPPGSGLIRPEWVYGDHPGCLDRDRAVGESIWDRTDTVRIISVDPAPFVGYTGWIVLDLVPGSERYEPCVVDLDHGKMGLRDLVRLLEVLANRYGPIDYLVLEVNTPSKTYPEDPELVGWLVKNDIRLIQHLTTAQSKSGVISKHDVNLGLESLASDFEFGRIRLPYSRGIDNNPSAMGKVKLLVDEAENYPFHKTSDVLMALWFPKFVMRQLRFKHYVPVNPNGQRFHTGSWLRSRGWHKPERVAV